MKKADLLSLLLIVLAAARIVATLSVFSATSDEANHISAGMQLIRTKQYTWQVENPPLPRIVLAYPLHRAGAIFRIEDPWDVTTKRLFHTTGDYRQAMFLARVGNLTFFLIAALAVWALARRELGAGGGLLATFLFTTQPIVLGMSGIANFDIAAVAGLAVALLAFSRWLDEPTPARAFLAGAAAGFSVALKFSNLLFTPAAFLAVFIVNRRDFRKTLTAIPIAAAGAFLAVWACYGFVTGSLDSLGIAKPPLLASIDGTTPIPMPHFFAGVGGIAAIDKGGFQSYAFGRVTMEGWWWYFPAAMLFKTTLAVLLFVLLGFFVARGRLFFGAIAAVAAILLTVASTSLDLGVRYVLPAYAPLTIAAAAAALAMLRHAKKSVRIAAIVLLSWQAIASAIAHPDYFPYFNELAGREPSRFFIDSNLDWGQDLLRLRDALEEERATSVALHVAGLHDYDALGFPRWTIANPWSPVQGWVAVSEHPLRILEKDGGFGWLRGKKYRRIGKSIRLYHVD